jgi:hypothetical protein
MRTHFFRTLSVALAIWMFSISVPAQNCSRTFVGLTPLNDLSAGSYRGFQGGLYPAGSNQRPWPHDSVGLALAGEIQPLDASGAVDPTNGKIVLISIGMSNATQEFSMFKTLADTDRARNPRLVIVDGAQGGQTAAIISNPSANFWSVVDQRLASAGATRSQVQAAWVKEADAGPTEPFPTHALKLLSEFEGIARILKLRYPNIRVSYWASRTYGGYATTSLNPEPYAYESGFAVKWLIEKQIDGDTSLSHSGSNPRAPWLAWGPYLWADGMSPRGDGLIWECSDFQSDGTHPSNSGRLKVAQLLLSFFRTDPTAQRWYLQSPPTSIEAFRDELPSDFSLEQNYPNPFNPTTTIRFSLTPFLSQWERVSRHESGRVRATLKVFDVLGREMATLADGELNPGEHTVVFNAKDLSSGVYFYRLIAGRYFKTVKMMLMK